MSWPIVALGDVLEEALPGFASGDDLEEGIFQIRMNNISRRGELLLQKRRRVSSHGRQVARTLLSPGDVLFNATNSPDLVGKTAYFAGCEEPVVYSNHFVKLRPRADRLDGRYLSRWLQREFERGYFKAKCKQWAGQATFGQDRLAQLHLPLPPVEEQTRIASVLDAADALRATREGARAALDALPQAIFMEMFGDPVANVQGWDRVSLGAILRRIDSGKSPVCLNRPADQHEWGLLKAGAVTYCTYDDRQQKALPEQVRADPGLEVRVGDLLFSRKNTYELVGASAFVHETRSRLMLSDLIFRLVLASDAGIDPVFLHQQLIHPRQRAAVQRVASGSSGSMPNISKERLRTVEVTRPPLELQRDFDQRVAGVRAAGTLASRASRELDALFASLQQRAFVGQL